MASEVLENIKLRNLPFYALTAGLAAPRMTGYGVADVALEACAPEGGDSTFGSLESEGHCVTGILWAVAVEAAAALVFFGIWRFAHILR